MDYNKKIDFSSLATYIDCPRKFLFQYIFHFRSVRPNIHLIFGSCWHYGLEIVYKSLQENQKTISIIEATEISQKEFNMLWEIIGEPHFSDHDLIFPKSPGHAHNMYHKYWEYYLKNEDADKKIIAVESSFSISLDSFEQGLPNYIGRQDLIFQLPDGTLEIIDHKTAKALWATTLAGFESSYQTDGYLTSGYLYYDSIPKMTYSIAFCQKSKIDFQRFTIVKRQAALEQFLSELVHKVKTILTDLTLLSEYSQVLKNRNDILPIFHRSPGYACTAYMSKCPYFDLCLIRSNPLLWQNNPPQGYSINEWDPDLHDLEMRRKLAEIN